MIGLIIGMVIGKKRAAGPAPSTFAASYSSVGTAWRAARKMIIVPPTPHSITITMDGIDIVELCSQELVGRCSFARIVFARPTWGLRMIFHSVMDEPAGSTSGG